MGMPVVLPAGVEPRYWYGGLVAVLLTCYWVWDECNMQKNEYRAKEKGCDLIVITTTTTTTIIITLCITMMMIMMMTTMIYYDPGTTSTAGSSRLSHYASR